MAQRICLFAIFLVFHTCIFVNSKVDALATMAIDMGTEFMKIAIVKPGVPMEIALNPESQRKSPCIISFHNGERLLGSPASTAMTKYPESVVQEIPLLIGRNLQHPAVQMYQKRYPYHKLGFNETSGLLYFELNKVKYSVDELYGMLLEHGRSIAESYAGTAMKATIITVPYHFGQAERHAVLRAASLINLDVLQLINSNTAVALNFGVFHRKSFNATVQNYMFFDMGALGTTVTMVSYHVGKHRDGDGVDENPILQVLGVGSDPLLGTSHFVYKMRDHLAKLFNANKKIAKGDITKNNRAMAKLTKEATRVAKVLSANTDTFAQVEGLLEEEDFRHKVTREEFETMCADLFERIKKPIENVIVAAQLALPNVKEVLLMGGGSRIPRVQDVLRTIIGRTELGKSINTDEAAALGAVYQAAYHSPGFRVLRFVVKDANPYAIAVDFERVSDDPTKPIEFVRRTLFTQGNPYPQKRAITFNKQTKDKTFYVSYANIDPSMAEYLGSYLNITSVKTKGVEAEIKQYMEELKDDASAIVEVRGVKAHFNIDFSGILTLTSIDTIFEPIHTISPNTTTEEGSTDDVSKSTFEKLGNTISGLFGTKEDTQGSETSENRTTENAESTNTNTETNNGASKPEETANTTESAANNKTDLKTDKKSVKFPKKKSTEPLVKKILFDELNVGFVVPTTNVMDESQDKLMALRDADTAKFELERSRNELEGYLFNTQDRVNDDSFKQFSTEAERTGILELTKTLSAWYEEQDVDVPADAYNTRLEQLKTLVAPVFHRIQENESRPNALTDLRKALNLTQTLLDAIEPMNALTLGLLENAHKLKKEAKLELNKAESESKNGENVDAVGKNAQEGEDKSAAESKQADVTPEPTVEEQIKLPSHIHPDDRTAIINIANETKGWLTDLEDKLSKHKHHETFAFNGSDIESKTSALKIEAKFLTGRMVHWRSENSKIETEIRTAELLKKYKQEKDASNTTKVIEEMDKEAKDGGEKVKEKLNADGTRKPRKSSTEDSAQATTSEPLGLDDENTKRDEL